MGTLNAYGKRSDNLTLMLVTDLFGMPQ